MLRLLVIFVVGAFAVTKGDTQRAFALTARYPGETCDGTPALIEIEDVAYCELSKCSDGAKISTTCSSDSTYLADVASLFGRAPYVIRETYSGNYCSTFRSAEVFHLVGDCVEDGASGMFTIAKLGGNGSVFMQYFDRATCSLESLHHADFIPSSIVKDHSCYSNSQKWYASPDKERSLASVVVASDDLSSTDTSTAADGAAAFSVTGTSDGSSSTFGADATLSTTGETSTVPFAISTDSIAETNPLGPKDISTVSADRSTGPSSTGSSTVTMSPVGTSSSGGSIKIDVDTDIDDVDRPSTSSGTVDSTESRSKNPSESSTRSSSAGIQKRSRVKIATAAPELDTSTSISGSSSSSAASDATGSVQESSVAITSASGSSTSMPVATTKSGIGTVVIVGIVMGSLVVGFVTIGSIIRRRTLDDDDIQSPQLGAGCRRSSRSYWGQASPVNRQGCSQQHARITSRQGMAASRGHQMVIPDCRMTISSLLEEFQETKCMSSK